MKIINKRIMHVNLLGHFKTIIPSRLQIKLDRLDVLSDNIYGLVLESNINDEHFHALVELAIVYVVNSDKSKEDIEASEYKELSQDFLDEYERIYNFFQSKN